MILLGIKAELMQFFESTATRYVKMSTYSNCTQFMFISAFSCLVALTINSLIMRIPIYYVHVLTVSLFSELAENVYCSPKD